MIEKAEGIMLGGLRYGDTSRIVRIYTKEFGKMSFMAKGAIRKNNKYGAAIETLSNGNYQFIAKNTGLNLLTAAELNTYYSKTIKNNKLLPISLSIIEIIDSTQAEHDPNEHIFDMIRHYLEMINMSEANAAFANLVCFLFDYIAMLGYMIDLNAYNPMTPYNYFLFEDGVISMGGFAGKRFFKLPTPLIKKILSIGKQSINFSNDEQQQVRIFFEQYLSFHFDKKIQMRALEYLL